LKKTIERPLSSLHASYRPGRDISLLEEDRRQRAVNHTIKALDLACDLGISLVILHCSESPIQPGDRPKRLDQARRSLAALVSEARHRQVHLAVEFLPPEWLGAGSEISDYTCTREMAEISVSKSTITLDLPVRNPELTLRLTGILVNQITIDGQPLREAKTRRGFKSGTFYRSEIETLLAFNPQDNKVRIEVN
jgi:hypothetical protein